MPIGRAICTIVLACLALWPLSAASPVMPVSEVKPGMVGIGRTVFAGTTVEEFKAHILGVLENAMGPNRNLILARLEGGPLATTGVIAGMSGSPVYHRRPPRGRRLLLARRLLARAHRRHHAHRRDGRRHAQHQPPARRHAGARGPQPAAQFGVAGGHAAAGVRAHQPVCPVAGRCAVSPASAPAPVGGAELGAMLRPIATPLVMGGFRGEVADLVSSGFAGSGFAPMTTGGASTEPHRRPRHWRRVMPSASVWSAATWSWAARARSPRSMARASTRSATRSTTSGRRRSR